MGTLNVIVVRIVLIVINVLDVMDWKVKNICMKESKWTKENMRYVLKLVCLRVQRKLKNQMRKRRRKVKCQLIENNNNFFNVMPRKAM